LSSRPERSAAREVEGPAWRGATAPEVPFHRRFLTSQISLQKSNKGIDDCELAGSRCQLKQVPPLRSPRCAAVGMTGVFAVGRFIIPRFEFAPSTELIMADAGPLREIRIQLKTRMDKAVEDFRKAMAATRTGRASVHMLDAVSVDYYGSQMPLNQIAQVHAPESQLITVQPFDPTSLVAIEKAIRTADLGLNPMNDGKIIRVPVPPLTEERRKDMVKHLHKVLEEHRTAVRNIRRDGNDAIKKAMKDKKIAEDDEKRAMEEIQKLTDDEIKKMEEMSKGKEKEVMEIK